MTMASLDRSRLDRCIAVTWKGRYREDHRLLTSRACWRWPAIRPWR